MEELVKEFKSLFSKDYLSYNSFRVYSIEGNQVKLYHSTPYSDEDLLFTLDNVNAKELYEKYINNDYKVLSRKSYDCD